MKTKLEVIRLREELPLSDSTKDGGSLNLEQSTRNEGEDMRTIQKRELPNL